jgi:hypothetical protein
MSKKRTSLEALLRSPEPSPDPGPGPEAEPSRPVGEGRGRRAVRQQTVYLPLPVYEQLRRLAFDERVKMHGLLMEGLDRVFRDRGLPGLAALAARSEDD